MDEVIIRDAKKSDINDIYNLISILEDSIFNKRKFSRIFLDNLKNSKIYYKVAVLNNAAVGFISLIIQSPLHHTNNIAEIQELVIIPGLRGIGLGKKLLQEMENTALKCNCELLEVASNKNRMRAHKFYEANGFMSSHLKLTKKVGESI